MEVQKGTSSKKQIADHYGLAQNTLSMWLKEAEEIKNAFLTGMYSTKCKKLHTARYPEVEEALHKWFKAARDHNVPISGSFMMQWVLKLARKLGVPKCEFKCSNGWPDRFKERHSISFKPICHEENSVDTDSDQMEEWHWTLPIILKEHTPDNFYNADKMGLFICCLTHKTLDLKN